MVLGTGFPPFRGGPLRYADAVGVSEVAGFLERTGEPRLKPCDHLVRLQAEGGRFYGERLERVASAP
jgi:3-hydroxyacyl-CoA dehydrogenase/enoyl-CoA hydratase/3-hydroxybutyryl-CoA epimerase